MYQSAIVVGEVPTDSRIYYHFFRKTCMTIYVYMIMYLLEQIFDRKIRIQKKCSGSSTLTIQSKLGHLFSFLPRHVESFFESRKAILFQKNLTSKIIKIVDYTSQNHKNTIQRGGGLKTKNAARKCLGATCVLFIIVPNNYTFTLVNVNVDKKIKPLCNWLLSQFGPCSFKEMKEILW